MADGLERDFDVLDLDDFADESVETIQCPSCLRNIKLDTTNLEVNQACKHCGELLNLGNVYDVEGEFVETSNNAVLITGRKIKGGMASLRSRDKRSYLDDRSQNATVLDETETQEGLINKINQERMRDFLHPVLCFLELYQRILMYQVDYLINFMKLSTKLREYTGQIWLTYLQQIKITKLMKTQEDETEERDSSMVDLDQLFGDDTPLTKQEKKKTNSMIYNAGPENETRYLWSHMPEPWQTLVFIYLGCVKLCEPMMLCELKRMAETGKLPYRNVCTHLYTSDRTFQILSQESVFFKMSGGLHLWNYNKRSYPILFRDSELPSCKKMWRRACEMYAFFGLSKIGFPPISPYSYINILCEKVLQVGDEASKDLRNQILAYSCALIRMCSSGHNEQINISAASTNMDFWFEEWKVQKDRLQNDLSGLRRFAPEVYTASYFCISLKICFGLCENECDTHPAWTAIVNMMLARWNEEHRKVINNTNYTASNDPPHSLSTVTVHDLINLIEGNDSMTPNNADDEDRHPYVYDLKSKKHQRIQGIYRQMRNALFGESKPEVAETVVESDTVHQDYVPRLNESKIIDYYSKRYVKYKEFGGWSQWMRGRRLEGRVNDGTPREHLQFSFLLEAMSEFLSIKYEDLFWCVHQCEKSL